jgi:hypothetical protein
VVFRRPSIPPGTVVRFEVGKQGAQLTRSGFAEPEESHTWTVAPVAILSLCLSQPPSGSQALELKFKVLPFVPAGRPKLDVLVTSGSIELGRWQFHHGDGSTDMTVRVLSEAVRNGCIDLNFNMSGTASPLRLGISEDPRELGLAFQELSVGYASGPGQ